MLLSTLRGYVEAMGGSLRLVAEFPDGIAELSSLGEALDTNASERAAKAKKNKAIETSSFAARSRQRLKRPGLRINK